jgi:carbonic anhydrase
MSKILDEVLAANRKYAETFGDKATLALPPARRFAILTCMDARLDPAKYAGLSEGDAHVIRNAGGRASDDVLTCDFLQAAGNEGVVRHPSHRLRNGTFYRHHYPRASEEQPRNCTDR